MITLDIFNDDAFSLRSLTRSIVDLPHNPSRIGELGYFAEEGTSTLGIQIERVGSALTLVPTAARGSSGKVMTNDKRKLIPLNCVHLPQRAAVMADEVMNLRAFGTETDVELVSAVVNKKLTKMRRDLDVTLEFHRLGAIKGQVLDADATSVLYDMYDIFNMTPQSKVMDLDVDATRVIVKCMELKRLIEAALGGKYYKSIRVFCSADFFDAFVAHPAVEKAWYLYNQGAQGRTDNRAGFEFGGIIWEEYRGQVGAVKFIADGTAVAVPEGVSDMFITTFAAADRMDTVGTMGLPYYAFQELRDMNKGVDLESQSNPIMINTQPNAVITLSIN